MDRHLIVDGDVYAYQAAAAAEEVVNLGDDTLDGAMFQVSADWDRCTNYIDEAFEALMDLLSGTNLVVTLSDGAANWRKTVLPSYKANRAAARRPIILPQARQYIRDRYSAWERPTLEGDDVIGILCGLRERLPGERIAITIDKDLSTVPGLHYRPHQSILGVFEVAERDADLFHLAQGIAGDPTDGYAGCPGMGMQSAKEWLEEPYKLVPETYTVHRGKHAGVEKVRWVKEPVADIWDGIVSLYQRAGLTEEDAIPQFQVARILRASDYNFKKKEPILWTPKLIPQF